MMKDNLNMDWDEIFFIVLPFLLFVGFFVISSVDQYQKESFCESHGFTDVKYQSEECFTMYHNGTIEKKHYDCYKISAFNLECFFEDKG